MARKIIDFLTSPTGKFIGFFIVIVIGCLAFNFYKGLPTPKKEAGYSTFNDEVNIDREYSKFRDGFLEDGDEHVDDTGEVVRGLPSGAKPIKSKFTKKIDQAEKKADDLEKRLAELEAALAKERIKNLAQKSLPTLPSPQNIAVQKDESVKPKFHISPVNLYTSRPQKKVENPRALSDTYAPYGRMIKCQLVNTVDSANMKTPIIAIVTNDVWHNGKKVIPAGTEVHGTAQAATLRDRIATAENWVAVWRTQTPDNGKELPLSAIALDYTQDINSKKYSITDGSAGLRGFTVKTDEYAELKMYAALFLKGAGEGVTDLLLEEASADDQNTFNGNNNSGSQQNSSDKTTKNQVTVGLAKGGQEVADLYAKRMLDAITRDGVFVRVPAGTTFYLYVQQTIDKAHARAGATIGLSAPQDIEGEERAEEEARDLNRMMMSMVKERLKAHQQRTDNIQPQESKE